MKRAGVSHPLARKLLPYLEAIRACGVEPLSEYESLEEIDGLVLTGGTDVDPACYGAEPAKETKEPDAARDAREFRLLQEALERDLPVLAICRGMQLFNVFHGGTLVQHLSGAYHAAPHLISVAFGSKLASISGAGPRLVNSRHHQGVAVAGKGLRVAASANDGLIEALEHPDRRFAVAVQWHPEDLAASSLADKLLFEAFAAAMEN